MNSPASSDFLRKKRALWFGLGVLSLIIAVSTGSDSPIMESVYGRWIYPGVRWLFGHTMHYLPFPGIWMVFGLMTILAYRTIVRPLKRGNWHWRGFIGGLLSTLCAVIFLFYILWGFNYSRPSIAHRLSMNAPPLDQSQLEAEYERATKQLVAFATAHRTVLESNRGNLEPATEAMVSAALSKTLDLLDYPMAGRVKGRLLGPKGILLRFNTAGIYIPFSGEGHVDAGMLPIQIPFTMAHELAHGQGVTDEGECNFLAYLTCKNSNNRWVQFSGLLGYWRYVASEYRKGHKQEYRAHYRTLPEIIRILLDDIHQNNKKYPEIMPRVRNKVYDSYLKSQGVQEGLRSYSTVVRMVHAYESQLVSDVQ